MKEDSVFWIGRGPGGGPADAPPAREKAFQDAIACCCEAAGLSVARFIAAEGRFGTWLVEGTINGAQRRILWNGREKQLVLQQPAPGSGWDDPRAVSVSSEDLDGFRAGIRKLLDEPGAG